MQSEDELNEIKANEKRKEGRAAANARVNNNLFFRLTRKLQTNRKWRAWNARLHIKGNNMYKTKRFHLN
jgi:hypothetical protein